MSVSFANDPWIRLYTGTRFHLANPRQREIHIEDIAMSLSRQNRFYGHTHGEPYSTAQHCVLGAQIFPEYAFHFLMHDAAEAYSGDVNAKLKLLLPDYKRIEKIIEIAVNKRFKLPYPFPPEVKQADLIMLATEMRDLQRSKDWKLLPYKPLPAKIVPWGWKRSYDEFMKAFKQLST